MSLNFLEKFPASIKRQTTFKSGRHLFRLGSPVRILHFILSGEVHLIRVNAKGSPILLQRATSGAILAEASLYSPKYHCDAIAIEPTTTISIPTRDIKDRLSADPALSEIWMKHLAHEVQALRFQAELLAMKTVSERLDAWIAWKGEDTLKKGEWKNVAHEIGVSPEAFYREMSKRSQPHAQPTLSH